MTHCWLDSISPSLQEVAYWHIRPKQEFCHTYSYVNTLLWGWDGVQLRADVEGEEFSLGAGEFLYIPAGRWHRRWATSPDRFTVVWLYFSWQYPATLVGRPFKVPSPGSPDPALIQPQTSGAPTQAQIGRIHDPDLVASLLERLNYLYHHGSLREVMRGRGILLELLVELFGPRGEADIRPDFGRFLQKVERDLANIAAMPFSRSPSIRECLAANGMAYETIERHFKRELHLTPKQYLDSIRVEHIKALLRETDATVESVAEESGFDNLGYFFRWFKKNAGTTPASYRNAYLRNGVSVRSGDKFSLKN